jgi:glycosyltransferase involved in cell wall biosynthesis
MVFNHHPTRSARLALMATTRLLYPLADETIVNSIAAGAELARMSHLPARRFRVLANPLEFPAKIGSDPAVEARWGDGAKRILHVGRFKADKNQALLLRAFARLPRELDARLMLLGTGPLEAELRRIAADEGVADRVIFPGFAVDPWPYYASADLFVLTSNEESFGNVLVEALYAGLPVVSTNCAGAIEVLDGGRFGTLAEKNDLDGLVAAIVKALRSKPDLQGMRERAVELSGETAFARYERMLLGPLGEDVGPVELLQPESSFGQ